MRDVSDRGRGDAAKKSLEHEARFRILARRNKLLGLWAANHLGLGEDEAAAYAKGLAVAAVVDPREDAVVARVAQDLQARGIAVAEAEVRSEAERLTVVAQLEFGLAAPDKTETGPPSRLRLA